MNASLANVPDHASFRQQREARQSAARRVEQSTMIVFRFGSKPSIAPFLSAGGFFRFGRQAFDGFPCFPLAGPSRDNPRVSLEDQFDALDLPMQAGLPADQPGNPAQSQGLILSLITDHRRHVQSMRIRPDSP